MKPRINIHKHTVLFGQRVLFKLFYYIQIALRFLRLHLSTQWTQAEEKPKVVLYHHRGIALIQSTVYIAPLAIVIASMVLNIQSYYWGHPSTTVLAALQFASKFAEILMQSSLANILLHIIRDQLLSAPHGLPLGSLPGAYSITDVSYLWSLELWGGMTSNHVRARQRFVSTLAIVAMVILAAVVGPSIAVLLIPRSIDYGLGRYLILMDNEATLFPKVVGLNGSSLP